MATAPTPQVRYYAAQSLDGYIAETDHTIAWLLEHDARTQPADDGVGGAAVDGEVERFLDGIGALVVGARTYEYVLGEGAGWPYAGRPTWVLTHQDLPVPDGADVRMARAAQASSGECDGWVIGGGPVAQDVAEAGLLDTVEGTILPVVLGGRRPAVRRPPARAVRAQRCEALQQRHGAAELRATVAQPLTTRGRPVVL